MNFDELTQEDFKVVYAVVNSIGIVAGVTIGEQPCTPDDGVLKGINVLRLHFPMSMQVYPEDQNDPQSPLMTAFIPMVVVSKPLDIPLAGQALGGCGILPSELSDEYLRVLASGTEWKSASTDMSSSDDSSESTESQ